jgi:hypothetical protein
MYIYVDLDPLVMSMTVFDEIMSIYVEEFFYFFICLSAGFGSRHEWFAGNIDQVRNSSDKITNVNVPYCQSYKFPSSLCGKVDNAKVPK